MDLKVENRVNSNLRTQMILQNLLKAMMLRLATIKRERQLIQMQLKVQLNLSSKLEKSSTKKMAVYQ
jgi:hypothetical protein